MDLHFTTVYVQRFDSIEQVSEREAWNIQHKRMFTEEGKAEPLSNPLHLSPPQKGWGAIGIKRAVYAMYPWATQPCRNWPELCH